MTPQRMIELKQEAAELKVELGIKHSAALARIAQREGFRSWEELIGRSGGRDVLEKLKREAPPTEAQARRAERRTEHLAEQARRHGEPLTMKP